MCFMKGRLDIEYTDTLVQYAEKLCHFYGLMFPAILWFIYVSLKRIAPYDDVS